LALASGCSNVDGSGSGAADAGVTAGITAATMSAGDDGVDGGGDGDGDGDGDAGDGDGDGDGTGPKFDVGAGDGDGDGDDGGPQVPFTCDNLDQYDPTSIGCEFWSTNWRADPGYGLGIGVGNPSQSMATVTLEQRTGAGVVTLGTLTLAPQESKVFNVNGPGGILPGQNVNVSNGANPYAAFRVSSDVPITAMQVAPLGGGPSHVSEASLLLPQNALDTSHFAVGYPPISGTGTVAVVGTEDGTTINTTAGTATLNAFDVQVFSPGDPTGFFVGADKPVAVFSGTHCSFVPAGTLACDHLEEQVVPASSWGTKYVGGRHPVRYTASNSAPEPVYWRVIAGVDNMTVTVSPAVVAGGSINLGQAGEFFEFTATESFVAESTQPFMLVQYMASCRVVTPNPVDPMSPCGEPATGDPYMVQMPPVDQWLDALPFLTDTSYPRDFVILMREQGTTIDLDCLGPVDASHFTPIPGTNYEVGTVDLDAPGGGEGSCVDGEQFVSASAPIGIVVGGLDWATSYGYAGGLAFSDLWVPPTTPPG